VLYTGFAIKVATKVRKILYPYRVKMYSGTQSFGIPDAIWEWEVGWSLSSGSLLLPISKMCQQTFCILASQQS
jgi:hypothetical protein